MVVVCVAAAECVKLQYNFNSCCHCQSDNFHLLHVNINISSILLECRSTLLSLHKIDPAVEEAVPSKVTEWCQHIENAT